MVSTDLQPVRNDLRTHAHVGFLARGVSRRSTLYGCGSKSCSRVGVLKPATTLGVVGDERLVLIQFDAEGGTANCFGLPEGALPPAALMPRWSAPHA